MGIGYIFRGGLNQPPPVADMSFQRLWQLGLSELALYGRKRGASKFEINK